MSLLDWPRFWIDLLREIIDNQGEGNSQMVYITHVRMSPPASRHEHITHVKWSDPATGQADSCPVSQMVGWIEKGGQAKVTDGRRTVDVVVVHADPPHLRTVADGVYTDNLLALPRF